MAYDYADMQAQRAERIIRREYGESKNLMMTKADKDALVREIPEDATCAETANRVATLLGQRGYAYDRIEIVGYGHTWNRVDGEIVDIWSYRRGLPEGPDDPLTFDEQANYEEYRGIDT